MRWSLGSPAEIEKDPEYWREQAQETLQHALRLQHLNQNVAKNLILFLGDGETRAPTGGGRQKEELGLQ